MLWGLRIRFSPHYIGSSFSTIAQSGPLSLAPSVSVPIISGLLFQLKRGELPEAHYKFQSPLYRVFFFNHPQGLADRGSVLPFQSPLYRVFFFNCHYAISSLTSSTFQSPLYRVFFFNCCLTQIS